LDLPLLPQCCCTHCAIYSAHTFQPQRSHPAHNLALPVLLFIPALSFSLFKSSTIPQAHSPYGAICAAYVCAVIMQGIAARYALRQASGKTAQTYAAQMAPYGEWAWGMVEDLKREKERAGMNKSTGRARL
jgi:hypothetical protein